VHSKDEPKEAVQWIGGVKENASEIGKKQENVFNPPEAPPELKRLNTD